MATTYETLYTKVLLRLPQPEQGKSLLAAKEGVNTAQKIIARVQDFDELVTTDTTNAATVASTKTYHLVDDWSLTRPKDILSLRLMDETNSRKLSYYSPRELDEIIPYVEQLGEQRSALYTQRGEYVDLLPIPDDAYDLYVMYSQWPLELSGDTDETSYSEIDDVIIHLATVVAKDILDVTPKNTRVGYDTLAKELLNLAVKEENSRPDQFRKAKPFNPYGERQLFGEWWKHPHIRRDP
jgi:hypothetical protein